MAATTTPQSPSTHAEIGEAVHRVMWRQRMTQTALADRLDITQSTLSRKLRGERPWDAHEVRLAARALGTTVSELYGEADDNGPDVDPGAEAVPVIQRYREQGHGNSGRTTRAFGLIEGEAQAA